MAYAKNSHDPGAYQVSKSSALNEVIGTVIGDTQKRRYNSYHKPKPNHVFATKKWNLVCRKPHLEILIVLQSSGQRHHSNGDFCLDGCEHCRQRWVGEQEAEAMAAVPPHLCSGARRPGRASRRGKNEAFNFGKLRRNLLPMELLQ